MVRMVRLFLMREEKKSQENLVINHLTRYLTTVRSSNQTVCSCDGFHR